MNLTKEIEKERQELREILSRIDDDMFDLTSALKKLACQVGENPINIIKGYGQASVPQLTQNIHHALQTKSMIASLQISQKYLVFSIILASIAFFSMVATWIGVLYPF